MSDSNASFIRRRRCAAALGVAHGARVIGEPEGEAVTRAGSRAGGRRGLWWFVLIGAAILATACDKGGSSTAVPASAASAAPTPAPAPAPPAAATGNPAGVLVGTWRQICQPFLPGDGASDITYEITVQGKDSVKLAGVARDYKNTACSGTGTVIATPVFVQKVVGTATVAGITVLKLVDEDAGTAAPAQSKSIAGIDQGRLRFGAANGSRDGDGFPAQFEKPTDAYEKR